MTKQVMPGQQVGGNHYAGMAIDPMTYAYKNALNAPQFTIVKYVSRYDRKWGNNHAGALEDLRKAAHTLQMLITEYEGLVDEQANNPIQVIPAQAYVEAQRRTKPTPVSYADAGGPVGCRICNTIPGNGCVHIPAYYPEATLPTGTFGIPRSLVDSEPLSPVEDTAYTPSDELLDDPPRDHVAESITASTTIDEQPVIPGIQPRPIELLNSREVSTRAGDVKITGTDHFPQAQQTTQGGNVDASTGRGETHDGAR